MLHGRAYITQKHRRRLARACRPQQKDPEKFPEFSSFSISYTGTPQQHPVPRSGAHNAGRAGTATAVSPGRSQPPRPAAGLPLPAGAPSGAARCPHSSGAASASLPRGGGEPGSARLGCWRLSRLGGAGGEPNRAAHPSPLRRRAARRLLGPARIPGVAWRGPPAALPPPRRAAGWR